MKTAFFITSFNDPESAALSMPQFGPLFQHCDRILADQSDNEEHACRYAQLCDQHGFLHRRFKNQGASAAKRNIVRVAKEMGYQIMHQISEDFELTNDETRRSACPSGHNAFVADAERILIHHPHIAFVNWSWFRSRSGTDWGYEWGKISPSFEVEMIPGVSLGVIAHNVSLMNWPYSGRVEEICRIMDYAATIVPGTEFHKKQNNASGGEWSLSFVSRGRGACLFAHPVRHWGRVRPTGSLA